MSSNLTPAATNIFEAMSHHQNIETKLAVLESVLHEIKHLTQNWPYYVDQEGHGIGSEDALSLIYDRICRAQNEFNF